MAENGEHAKLASAPPVGQRELSGTGTCVHLANPGPGVAAHEDTDHEFPGGRRPLLSAVPAACLQGLLGFVLIEMLSM